MENGREGKVKKKGQLSSFQLITIVMALAAFVILSYVLYKSFSGSGLESSEAACELSVNTRATVPQATQGYIPLKCQTQKICLTDKSGNGKCGISFTGEKPTIIEISRKEDAKSKLEKTLANEMYDCWNMMGRGKLSLFNKGVLDYIGFDGAKKVNCVICSRIGFQNVQQDLVLGNTNIDSYLANTNVPGSSLTYLQTFTDKQFNSFVSTKPIDETEYQKVLDSEGGISFATSQSEMAIVFTQIIVPPKLEVLGRLAKIGTVGVAGGAWAFGASTFLKPIALIPLIVVGGEIAFISMVTTNRGQAAAAGYCGKLTTTSTSEDLSTGCSSVMIVPYDPETINKICYRLESTP